MKNVFRNFLKAIRGTDQIKEQLKQEINKDEETLVLFLRATWCQKQLDDLLLMNQGVLQQLKQSPFNPKFLEKRDKIHHDINALQPIVLETGIACGVHIEEKFGVQFCLLTGRNRPVPGKEAPAAKSIILPEAAKV